MAQRWTLASLLWEFQGIRSSLAKKFYIFVIFQGGGSGPPNPPLDPCMGPVNVYTYWDKLKPHPIVHIGICTPLLTFYRMRKFLNWRNILSWIPFGSDLDPNRFCKCGERERERRLVHAHRFGNRRIEVCVCVCACACSFWISSFFNSEISKFRLQIFAKKFWSYEMSFSDCLEVEAKAFWFSEVNESVAIHR